MNLSSRLKKRIGWTLLIFALFLLACGGTIYYIAVHRFKEGIRYLVDKESDGRMAFDASEATLSLKGRSIELKESILYCRDTTGSDKYFTVRIPTIYFSLTSWKALLFQKKAIVDSLSIIGPSIDIFIRQTASKHKAIDFRPADILKYLELALTHVNVRNFSLKDAAFRYMTAGSIAPLTGNHIDLSVSNFMVVNNEDSHLLGSDKVIIRFGKQRWILPDNRHEIAFSKMTFDSKGQRFELDSFSFYQKPDSGKGAIDLRADKFYFTSRHLPAVYQKDQLLLDTVTCINPILSIPGYAGTDKQDSAENVKYRNTLFKFMNARFVSVVDGQLLLENKEGTIVNAVTQKVNLSIYNVSVDPRTDPAVSSDSIRVNLKKIEFITRDSLYKLTIGEFAFHGKDAIFRDVRFGPASPGSQDKKVEFTAPTLLLKDISLVDLLRKHLKASAAELHRPLIMLTDHQTENKLASNSLVATTVAHLTPDKRMELFYRTLHNVSELIDTRDFIVSDGALHYQRTGPQPIIASVNRLNAHLLLNEFFISDSLVDIKRAIPDCSIGLLILVSNGTRIGIDNFRFNGIRQHSTWHRVHISTTGGLDLMGENVFWENLDWGTYQKNKEIQIDSLHADRLVIQAPTPPSGPTASMSVSTSHDPPTRLSPRDLPVIRIGRVDINEIAFDGGTSPVHLDLSNFHAADIMTSGPFFTWSRLLLTGHKIEMAEKKGKTSISGFTFDSDNDLSVKGLSYSSTSGSGDIMLSIPLIRLKTPIHSSDLRQLTIPSLSADSFRLVYSKPSGKDSIELRSGGQIRGTDLQVFPEGQNKMRYHDIHLTFTNTSLKKGLLLVDVPQSTLHLSGGNMITGKDQRPSFSSGVRFEWTNTRARFNGDSSTFSINGMAGNFNAPLFEWSPATKLNWRDWVGDITIDKGSVNYRGKKISAGAETISWDPRDQRLSLRHFHVLPLASRDTLFSMAQWQKDYISAEGEALSISGIRYQYSPADTAVVIRSISLDGITVLAARDRRLPFRHGIEKPMPTKLINTMPLHLSVDSILMTNSTIVYDERSSATGKWSSIPIKDLNGYILNVSNKNDRSDSLSIEASARLFDGHIRRFFYKESYADSLSTFTARSSLSPLDLTLFSQVSVPAAAISVTSGRSDTLYSLWQGNKYASFGTMNFYYDNLRVKVLNKKDSTKRGLGPTLATWIANLILPDKRNKASTIYTERDLEKFVFNYWVKAQTSGILSTVGLKSNKRYRKAYTKKSKQFSLPPVPPQ